MDALSMLAIVIAYLLGVATTPVVILLVLKAPTKLHASVSQKRKSSS